MAQILLLEGTRPGRMVFFRFLFQYGNVALTVDLELFNFIQKITHICTCRNLDL